MVNIGKNIYKFTSVNLIITVLAVFIHFNAFTQTKTGKAKIDSLILTAKNLLDSGKYQKASKLADEIIKLSRKVIYGKGKAEAYNILGEINEKNNDQVLAMRYYFGSAREYETGGDDLNAALIRIKIGRLFRNNGMNHKALEYFLMAGNTLLKPNNAPGKIKTSLLKHIADTYYDLKEYQKALEYYQRLEKLYENGVDSTLIDIYLQEINCFNELEKYELTLQYCEKLLEHYQKHKNIEQQIITLNNMGFAFKRLGDLKNAMIYFKKALNMENSTKGQMSYKTMLNIAIVYQNLGDSKNAVNYMLKAEKIAENSGDKYDAAQLDHLTSVLYYNYKDYYNSKVYNNEAIRLAKESGNTAVLIQALLTSSKLNEALYDFEQAMSDYRQYLKLSDSLRAMRENKKREMVQQQFIIERSEREIERLLADEDLKDVEFQRLKLENASKEQQLKILLQYDSIQKITIQKKELEKQKLIQEKLLTEEQNNAKLKDAEIKDLKQKEKIQSLELEKQKLIQNEQKNKIALLNKEKEINELNIKKIKARNNFLLGLAILALIILYLVYRMLRYSKKMNRVLVKQNNEIERQRDEIKYEHDRSEKLLLNILPKETAEELKEKGAATPRHYDMVSVLFTDFVGFTKIAEKLTAEELVDELNKCFVEFDKIIDKYGLEKIKTIGDAYMCAGGIPVPNTTNPVDIVKAGLEIRDFMNRLKTEKEAKGESFWELRIGIHTGDVIAGVVGKNKFAYDIWGDAVNTASRMESSGVPGKVNISGDTYELIKDKFRCTYRGKIKAKNKGEIDMYIVEEEL